MSCHYLDIVLFSNKIIYKYSYSNVVPTSSQAALLWVQEEEESLQMRGAARRLKLAGKQVASSRMLLWRSCKLRLHKIKGSRENTVRADSELSELKSFDFI